MQRYGAFNWDAWTNESFVKDDETKRLTYCGYLKFLSLDLADTYPIGLGRTKSAFKRGIEVIAKSMLKRGEVFVRAVKDRGAEGQGLNNILSQEWMPFHFDGMFKTQKHTRDDGSKYLVPNPPRFQYFAAVTPSPKNTGYTLWASSKLLLDLLPADKSLGYLQSLT